MALSEQQLATEFAARSRDALAHAYERYGRLLYTVARNALGDGAQAEDCVHDALLRVWRMPNSYRAERGPLRAFLTSCVRNEAMTMLRSSGRRAAREERAVRLEPVRVQTLEVADPVEAARLREALARLPDDQRTTLELTYFGNRTQAEVAALMQVPLGTVKSRLSTAIRRLASELRTPAEESV